MLEKALALAKLGLYVFPVEHTEDNKKVPLTKNGLHDASTHEKAIRAWWKQFPDAKVGVATGASGLVVLDIDIKNGKDGWDSLGFLEAPDTFWYETGTGGFHYAYTAPEGVPLSRNTNYRQMDGVDRQGGNSFVLWVGDVPKSYDEFTAAPDWLCDPVIVRSAATFEGTVKDWYDILVPGKPNALVRRAIESIHFDMPHGDMVKAQFHAIRLGAEGNPGVPELLARLEEAFLNRPGENHTTPEKDWEFKFAQALATGIEQFGEPIALLKTLKPFHPSQIPASVSDRLFVGPGEASKAEWSRALQGLQEAGLSGESILGIMWSAPKTMPLSRDWGIEFVDRRIQESIKPATKSEAKTDPVKTSEAADVDSNQLELLTPEERKRLQGQPTFEKMYNLTARSGDGFVNDILFRQASWSILSLTLGFHGYIPQSATSTLGMNLWLTSLAPSGTGKTTAENFESYVARMLFQQDNEEQPFEIGDQLSPPAMQEALLKRDKQVTWLNSDESSGFFKRLQGERYMAGLPADMANYYMGYVPPATKIRAADLKGKSARTSFNAHFRSTPDDFLDEITTEMFASGFLARMLWILAPGREYRRGNVKIKESDFERKEEDSHPPEVMEMVVFLKTLQAINPSNLAIKSDPVKERLEKAGDDMMFHIQNHPQKSTIMEPSVTRHIDTLRKVAAMVTLYRGGRTVGEIDALVAIQQVEEWFNNLLAIASKVSESIFSKQCQDILDYVLSRPGRVATRASIASRFKSTVRGPRDLEDRLVMLREMGDIVIEEEKGVLKYRANI